MPAQASQVVNATVVAIGAEMGIDPSAPLTPERSADFARRFGESLREPAPRSAPVSVTLPEGALERALARIRELEAGR